MDPIVDFSRLPAGTEYDGQALAPCPICGKMGLPGRRRNERTMIHKAVLVRGGLNITAFCAVRAPRVNYER
jgi:hypothetical protein